MTGDQEFVELTSSSRVSTSQLQRKKSKFVSQQTDQHQNDSLGSFAQLASNESQLEIVNPRKDEQTRETGLTSSQKSSSSKQSGTSSQRDPSSLGTQVDMKMGLTQGPITITIQVKHHKFMLKLIQQMIHEIGMSE